ncbi:hypothetical protein V8F06_014833 [Rhypophila decipiens]
MGPKFYSFVIKLVLVFLSRSLAEPESSPYKHRKIQLTRSGRLGLKQPVNNPRQLVSQAYYLSRILGLVTMSLGVTVPALVQCLWINSYHDEVLLPAAFTVVFGRQDNREIREDGRVVKGGLVFLMKGTRELLRVWDVGTYHLAIQGTVFSFCGWASGGFVL